MGWTVDFIAQDASAHLAGTDRWETSTLRDQLRKRAFWAIAGREMQLCLALGRGSCMRYSSVTIGTHTHTPSLSALPCYTRPSESDFFLLLPPTFFFLSLSLESPLVVDDEVLSRFCEGNSSQASTSHSINHLQSSLYSNVPHWVVQKTMHTMHHKLGFHVQQLWKLKVPRQQSKTKWDRALVKQFAHQLDLFMKFDIPNQAKWDPDALDERDLVATGILHW